MKFGTSSEKVSSGSSIEENSEHEMEYKEEYIRIVLFYDSLGVELCANFETVKKAYRQLARKYHPDKTNGERTEDKFQEIKAAYEDIKENQAYIQENKNWILANAAGIRQKIEQRRAQEAITKRVEEAEHEWKKNVTEWRETAQKRCQRRRQKEEDMQSWENQTRQSREKARKNTSRQEEEYHDFEEELDQWKEEIQKLHEKRSKIEEMEINLRIKELQQLKNKINRRNEEILIWDDEKNKCKERIQKRARLNEFALQRFQDELHSFEKAELLHEKRLRELDEEEMQLWEEDSRLRKEELNQREEIESLMRMEIEVSGKQEEISLLHEARLLKIEKSEVRRRQKEISQWEKGIRQREEKIFGKKLKPEINSPTPNYIPSYSKKSEQEDTEKKPAKNSESLNDVTKNDNKKTKLMEFCSIM